MIDKDQGFILKKNNFRNTSVLTRIYTYNYGKINGLLKGFYTPKKEFKSSLDLFTLNEFVFYPRKSEIWLVSYVECLKDYSYLRHSITCNSIGCSFLRIIDKCLAVNDPHPEIFNLLKNSLELLKGKDNLGILYIFLIKFLTLSGFKPELNRCLSCHEKVASKLFFSAKYGGLLCHRCHHKDRNVYPISRETSAAINYIQNNQFPQILRLNYTTKSEKEMIFILRRFLGYHLNFDPFTIINKLTPINC